MQPRPTAPRCASASGYTFAYGGLELTDPFDQKIAAIGFVRQISCIEHARAMPSLEREYMFHIGRLHS
jgi:hypothetical protein